MTGKQELEAGSRGELSKWFELDGQGKVKGPALQNRGQGTQIRLSSLRLGHPSNATICPTFDGSSYTKLNSPLTRKFPTTTETSKPQGYLESCPDALVGRLALCLRELSSYLREWVGSGLQAAKEEDARATLRSGLLSCLASNADD